MFRVILYFSDGSNAIIEIEGERGLQFFMITKELADYWNIIDENYEPISESGFSSKEINNFISKIRND